MASLAVLRRATSSRLLNSLRSSSVAPSVTRSFNTNAQLTNYDDDDRRLSRRRDSDFISDVFNPFFPTRRLNQAMNMMDRFMENPFRAAMEEAGSRRGWDMKEDEKNLYLRFEMPGLEKEDVKVWVEQNTLVIRGEGKEEQGERRYSTRMELTPSVYKADQIKAEMKNGVLKVAVPKVQEEERRNVHQVQID